MVSVLWYLIPVTFILVGFLFFRWGLIDRLEESDSEEKVSVVLGSIVDVIIGNPIATGVFRMGAGAIMVLGGLMLISYVLLFG